MEDPTHPVAVGRSLQVLRYFSRVLSAMVPMAHHPGLLDALVYQLERQAYGKHAAHFHEYDNGETRPDVDKEELASARIDAIATIVNLACAEENKAKMAAHQGLLDAVTVVAKNDPSEEAREHASIVIMNLAYEDENKVSGSLSVHEKTIPSRFPKKGSSYAMDGNCDSASVGLFHLLFVIHFHHQPIHKHTPTPTHTPTHTHTHTHNVCLPIIYTPVGTNGPTPTNA